MSFDSVSNITRVVGSSPKYWADSLSKHLVDLLNQQDVAPTPEKQKLQKMMDLLDYSKLAEIDSKCRQDNYLWGKQPLLSYSKEALTEYASIIYSSILPLFEAMTITEEEYVAKWTAPYTYLQAQLTLKAAGFISQLEVIATNPIINPSVIIEPEYDLYAQITAFLKGNNDFYEDLNDFLFNTFSPLRNASVTDGRVTALLAEVNALRDAYNKKLEAFAVKHSDFVEKTEEIHIPTENKNKEIVYLEKDIEKIRYKVPADKVLYGREMRRCRKLVKDCKSFHSLRPKTVAMLKAHKDKISSADWAIISLAIDSKVLSANTRKVIAANLKAIRNAIAQASTPVIAEPVDTFATNAAFISDFMAQLEIAYALPVIKDPKKPTSQELLDDVYTTIDALYTANTQGTALDTVQSHQEASEVWYSDYNNISQSLTVCLQISLNKVVPSTALSDEALNHGGIQGLLAFAKQIRNPDVYAYDYLGLAKELRNSIQTHTNYYTESKPLPYIVTMTKEQLTQSLESTAQQDTSFNITKYIQPKINKLRPTTALTDCAEIPLSADDIDALLPIPDHTIVELLSLACGTGTKPYLLKGNLIANTKDGKYLEILPHINDDGYASYRFTAINYKALNYRINKYCELLHAIPAYDTLLGYHKDEGEEFFGITPDFDYDTNVNPVTDTAITTLIDIFTDTNTVIDETSNAYALSTLNDLLKVRMQSSREHFGLTAIPDCQASQTRLYAEDLRLQECLKVVVKRVYDDLKQSYKSPYEKYYDPTYIVSGHHLSMWMSNSKEYTEKITFGSGEWSIDHILQGVPNRSNNSFENLRIKSTKFNSGRTSRSIPVKYNNDDYNSISDYCDITDAGNADNITDLKNSLNLGETKIYKGRAYTLSEDTKQLIATDAVVKTTQITFNGKDYITLKDFAKAMKLVYKSLNKALNDARKKNVDKFKFKKYTFYLGEDGAISKIL